MLSEIDAQKAWSDLQTVLGKTTRLTLNKDEVREPRADI
jgi:hypothetical protein